MIRFSQRNNYLLILLVLSLYACNNMPAEIRLKQLTAIRYYKKEMHGDVERKTHYYYKPTFYSFEGKAYTGKVKDYADDGKLKAEGGMKEGFPEGSWTYYNANGTLKSQGVYKDGVKDSVWFDYYTDGSPKASARYYLQNDSLRTDTISAWYYGGQRMIETRGDTVKRYYKSGRLMTRTVKGEQRSYELFMEDGVLIYRNNKHVKESYYTNGKLRTRTFYVRDKQGNEMMQAENHKWTSEEKAALQQADSVMFDYNSFDPVIKIYVRE